MFLIIFNISRMELKKVLKYFEKNFRLSKFAS